MCGIAGIIGSTRENLSHPIQKMNKALAHRGPDDEGVYVDDFVALGQTRLSIIDLSSNGHQPMWTEDGRLGIVFNGEIYNFKSLQQTLRSKGYAFRSRTDTETILHAFREWGTDCLHRLNGMFAFAIYDRQRKHVFIARDRMGIKPLYYTQLPSGLFLFASEIRSLISSGLFSPELHPGSVATFLKYQTVPPPDTLLKDVHMLPPGYHMSVNASGHQVRCYWHMLRDRSSVPEQQSQQSIYGEVAIRMQAAVERRMVSDVPIGAFLSGGIDSTLIVGLMSKVSSQPVRTFTVRFDDEKYKDAEYAQFVSNHFKTDHTEVTLTEDDVLAQIPEAFAAQDHPSSDGVNTYLVSRAAKEAGLTVVLSGLGGDELFAGYNAFSRLEKQQEMLFFWNYSPRFFRKMVGALQYQAKPSISSQKILEVLSSSGSLEEAYSITRQVYLNRQVRALLRSELGPEDAYVHHLRRAFSNDQGLGVLTKVSYAEATTYMHNVLLRDTDQMSMAHALEVRVPFLDHELVSYVMAVRDDIKRPNGITKKLLVNACKDILPERIINRPKVGFMLPFNTWIRGPLRLVCKEHLDSLSGSPLFHAPQIEKYWQSYLAKDKTISWSRIWLLVALGNWVNTHISR